MAGEVGGLIDGGVNEQGVTELRKMASRQSVAGQAQAKWLVSQSHSKRVSVRLTHLERGGWNRDDSVHQADKWTPWMEPRAARAGATQCN